MMGRKTRMDRGARGAKGAWKGMGMGVSQQFNAVAFLNGLYADPLPDPDQEPIITPAELPPEWRDYYEERAAVREYDGGQAREHAEAEALKETLAAMRAATVGGNI